MNVRTCLILLLLLCGWAWPEPVEIEFWHAMRGQRSQLLDRLAERFAQKNSGVVVRPRLVIDSGARLGNDYSALYRSLLESIARGNPPTVAQVYENWTTQLLEVEALVPVESFGPIDSADFVPVFLEANRFGGRLWTLPFNKSLWVLFYNRAVFKRLGLLPPKNWEELRSVARRISAEGSVPGLVFQPGVDTFGHYLVSNGGRFIEAGKAGFGGTVGIQDMTYWVELVNRDRSAFPTLKAVDIFAQGGAGMLLETTSKIPRLEQESGLDFGVTSIPAGLTSATQFAGTNLAIFSRSTPAQQKVASDFVRFLTSPEVTLEWCEQSGYVPVRRSVLSSPGYQEFLRSHPAHQGVLAGLDQAVSQPRVTGWESIRGLLDDAMFEAMSQKVTPEEAVRRAATLTDELLSKLQGGR